MDLTQAAVVAPSLLDKVVGPTSLFLKSKAPVIVTGLGIAGVITAAVLAARATRHLDPIIEDHKIAVGTSRSKKNAQGAYTDREHAKTLLTTYAKTTGRLCRLYGPSVTLGGLAIAAIITGHNMQYKRFVVAATALKSSEAALTHYREEVARVLGAETEEAIYRGVREEVVENEETGNEELLQYVSDVPASQYARVFAPETSPQWGQVAINNDFVVNGVEDYFNGRLQRLGHVFLSEVYEKLGFPTTQASHMVGWKRDGKDGQIKFKPQRFHRTNGDIVLLLDFNVDGIILTDLPEV